MVDFKGLEGLYDDINQVGSRPVGLMTEFTTEAGRPIYISHSGEIVSEKSTTIPYNGKYVNVPSIHDGIEYSEFELTKLLDEKQIKPTSTHKTQELAVKAAQKRSPSLMSEETARAVESKYGKEMTKRKATADQILGDSSTELVTPEAKANIQMRNLELINEDNFLGLVDPSDKTDKLDAYMSTLSEQDKLNIQKMLKKPKASINSIEGDESMAKGRARRNLEDQTVSAFAEGGMEDGGLKDEGGTVDPVSGNDVPFGSTQAEVRDDIPAQLSEGEFVFPADVVRYIGLENLMELRSKAKQGLVKMEAMGQMGNADEATMDDSGEYDGEIDELIENFDPNDSSTFEFNEGGVVMASNGVAALPNYLSTTPPQQQFSYGFMPPAQQGFQAPGYSVMPQQTQFITDPARVAVGQGPIAVENRTYVGPNGEEIIIPFYDGKPMQGYTIPGGYKYKKPEEAVAETPEVTTPVVTQIDGGGDGPQPQENDSPDLSSISSGVKSELDALGKAYDQLSDPDFKRGSRFGMTSGKYNAMVNNFNNALTEYSQTGMRAATPGVTGIVGGIISDVFGNGRKASTQLTASTNKILENVYGLPENFLKRDPITGQGYISQDDLETYQEAAEVVQGVREVTGRLSDYDKALKDAIDRGVTGDDLEREAEKALSKEVQDARAKARAQIDAFEAKQAAETSRPDRGKDITAEVRAELADRGLSTSDSPDDRDSEDSGTAGDRNDPSDPGGGFGPSFSKGGLAKQTQRALKSSRKK